MVRFAAAFESPWTLFNTSNLYSFIFLTKLSLVISIKHFFQTPEMSSELLLGGLFPPVIQIWLTFIHLEFWIRSSVIIFVKRLTSCFINNDHTNVHVLLIMYLSDIVVGASQVPTVSRYTKYWVLSKFWGLLTRVSFTSLWYPGYVELKPYLTTLAFLIC